MSNTILIKHGPGIPGDEVLQPYELGYDTTHKKLYIGIKENELNKVEAVSVGHAETANSATTATTASQVNNNLKIKLGTDNPIEYNGSAEKSIEIIPDSIGVEYPNKEAIVDLIYPVGSIYMSTNSTDPATFLGGTWTQLKDKFLLGAGDTYENGDSDGDSTHKLTIEEMPSHTHTFTGSSATTSEKGSHQHEIPDTTGSDASTSSTYRLESWARAGNTDRQPMTASAGEHTHTVTAKGTNSNTGGGKAFSIMPPYLVVYMWKRIA